MYILNAALEVQMLVCLSVYQLHWSKKLTSLQESIWAQDE